MNYIHNNNIIIIMIIIYHVEPMDFDMSALSVTVLFFANITPIVRMKIKVCTSDYYICMLFLVLLL